MVNIRPIGPAPELCGYTTTTRPTTTNRSNVYSSRPNKSSSTKQSHKNNSKSTGLKFSTKKKTACVDVDVDPDGYSTNRGEVLFDASMLELAEDTNYYQPSTNIPNADKKDETDGRANDTNDDEKHKISPRDSFRESENEEDRKSQLSETQEELLQQISKGNGGKSECITCLVRTKGKTTNQNDADKRKDKETKVQQKAVTLVAYCNTCDKRMCAECLDWHIANRMFRHHLLVNLTGSEQQRLLF